jgi:hypothetical protein
MEGGSMYDTGLANNSKKSWRDGKAREDAHLVVFLHLPSSSFEQ